MIRSFTAILAIVLYFSQAIMASPCYTPSIQRSGILTNTHYTYYFYGKWETSERGCVSRAFETWQTSLNPMIHIYFDEQLLLNKPNILITKQQLPPPVVGGLTNIVTNDSGRILRGGMVFTTSYVRPTTCESMYKVTLHEIGHLLGLQDTHITGQPTVMNHMVGVNDRHNNVPLAPTTCDIEQAIIASQLMTN